MSDVHNEMSEPVGIDIARILRKLRKHWWWIPVATVLGMIASVGLADSVPVATAAAPSAISTTTAVPTEAVVFDVILPEDTTTPLAAQAVGETLNFPKRSIVDLDASVAATKGVISTVSPTGALRLTAAGTDKTALEKAIQVRLEALRAKREREVVQTVEAATQQFDDRTKDLRQQLVTLDELATNAVPEVQGSLAVTRANLLGEMNRVNSRRRLLDLFKTSQPELIAQPVIIAPAAAVAAAPTSPAVATPIVMQTVRRFTPKRAILFGTLFAMLAAGLIAALALFDRRIYTRTDIERVSGPGSVVAIHKIGETNPVGLVLAALRHDPDNETNSANSANKSMTAVLVPVGGANVSSLAQSTLQSAKSLGNEASVTFATTPTIQTSPEGLIAARKADHTFIVTKFGVTNRDDLLSTLRTFAGAGVPLSGVVLDEVPPREIRAASK
jgi:hypothetical protein